jgi:SAM-dependent methyltransferase
MPDNGAIARLQKLADVEDIAEPQFEFVARHCLHIRPAMNPRVWEYVMAYRALDEAGMLNEDRRGIAFGSGREPLTFAVPRRAGFLCVTDFYSDSTAWDTARTGDPREFVLAAAPADFDASRIEVRSMDMREIEYPDHSFDFCYSISTLEHIGLDADFVRHLREVRRVLKPDGVYVLTTEMRVGGASFRVESNHCFDLDHLLGLFAEAGLHPEPHFDARLADRLENEGRELLDTRYHDASNIHFEMLIVREFGGITSVPGLFVLRPGAGEKVTVVGLAETAAWLRQRLEYKVHVSYSDWATLNPYGFLIGAMSPYCDLWRDHSTPSSPLLFGTAYKYFGSGNMEARVTIVTSPEAASRGEMAVCINSWSLDEVKDVTPVIVERVAVKDRRMVARRFSFRFVAVADRSYSIFGHKISGDIWLSDVAVSVRRAP